MTRDRTSPLQSFGAGAAAPAGGRLRLTDRERRTVDRAARMVGNKWAAGEPTANTLIDTSFPKASLRRRCLLLRLASDRAHAKGWIDRQGQKVEA